MGNDEGNEKIPKFSNSLPSLYLSLYLLLFLCYCSIETLIADLNTLRLVAVKLNSEKNSFLFVLLVFLGSELGISIIN